MIGNKDPAKKKGTIAMAGNMPTYSSVLGHAPPGSRPCRTEDGEQQRGCEEPEHAAGCLVLPPHQRRGPDQPATPSAVPHSPAGNWRSGRVGKLSRSIPTVAPR